MSDFSNPIFHDEAKAREWLEARLWPHGPICPHCAVIGDCTLMKGKTTRPGLYQCNACREPFTVTVGTLYERSKVPLHKWLAATHLMMASKKGMSALEVGRLLGFSKKTAWFVCHRIRESLRESNPEPMGGGGSVVEIDETYIGGKEHNRHENKKKRLGTGTIGKEPVFSLVERKGRVRSQHVEKVTGANLKPIIKAQLHRDTHVMTDEGGQYKDLGLSFASHGTVRHGAGEYVRGNVYTNTVEGYFSILKRGITGTFHHVSQQHLKRYLAEFDFRYNERESLGVNDAERFNRAIPGIVGKRLTYRRTDGQIEALNP
jgi:transposase-like protein